MSIVTLADRISELKTQYGSLSAAARVLRISSSQLSEYKHGRANPPDRIVRRMGLKRMIVTEYERLEKNQ
jgi:predicted transcriptional regulator